MSPRPPSVPDAPAADAGSVARGLFCKEGDYWTVRCGGKVFRLKDSLGLSFIAYLLLQPGTEFHVLDLGDGGSRPYVASCMAVGVPPHQ